MLENQIAQLERQFVGRVGTEVHKADLGLDQLNMVMVETVTEPMETSTAILKVMFQ